MQISENLVTPLYTSKDTSSSFVFINASCGKQLNSTNNSFTTVVILMT